MAEPSRRFPRYSLRTLFAAVTIFAVWLGWELSFIRQRKQYIEWVVTNGGFVSSPEEMQRSSNPSRPNAARIPFWRSWLGDHPIGGIAIPDLDISENDKMKAADRLFPEALLWVVPLPGSSEPP